MYARMIELRDGGLLCVYEADGSIISTRSSDKGSTWSEPVTVAPWRDGLTMATPEVIQLRDGSILVCYNPRPYKSGADKGFSIHTVKSYDGGRTWTDDEIRHEASARFKDGCWEPVAIQTTGGEVQLYFANEGPYLDSDEQEISMLRSVDGGATWTTAPETVSFSRGGRDGMPVPLELESGEVVCAIEESGWRGTLQLAIVRLGVGGHDGAGPVGRVGFRRERPVKDGLRRDEYGGAPYLRRLGSGETLLAYQGTEGRVKNDMHHADMKVLVGDGGARNFGGKTVPFDVPPNRCGLWNSLTVLGDDTVIALTSTAGYTGRTGIWMIKGRLVCMRATGKEKSESIKP